MGFAVAAVGLVFGCATHKGSFTATSYRNGYDDFEAQGNAVSGLLGPDWRLDKYYRPSESLPDEPRFARPRTWRLVPFPEASTARSSAGWLRRDGGGATA